ncbi:MAG: response regulator transcription factor [Candidatus Calescibacterium sp.]|nr:response regulator transcription factor [Candidatus Calescibacterium sp.]MCX7971890.1 response regulator transcription factor [bacterium]MDW8195011.1 response regulator transcription factor [Candidatus Calescibacterium sp.]
MSEAKILIVDDEKNIVELIKFHLKKESYKILEAYKGKDAIEIYRKEKPDLIILDLMLPDMGGFEVCKAIRKESKVPIIMLTAKGEEVDKILGFELGADDYITKPFSPRELIARIKAILKRSRMNPNEANEISIGPFRINSITREIYKDNTLLELKPKEFDLLKLFLTNPGRVFSRQYLLEQIWGYDYLGDTRTVDVHIRRLRQKVEDNPDSPVYIRTVHGVGYKFVIEE